MKHFGIIINNPTKYTGGLRAFGYVMLLTFLALICDFIKLITFTVLEPEWWIDYCFWYSLKEIDYRIKKRDSVK